MPAYKNHSIEKEIMKNAKASEMRDQNRYALLAKLSNGYYFLKLRSVYSGPEITKTIRFISKQTMGNLVAMWMELNDYSHLKIEDGQLMGAKSTHEQS
jgi:hypothetical protein